MMGIGPTAMRRERISLNLKESEMSGDLVPATRNWSAAEIAGAGDDPHDRFLKISGEVELTDANEKPQLTMSDPPSSDLSVLSLDLVLGVDGESVPGSHWASCALQNRTFPGAYASVRVMWQGVEVASLKL